MKTLVLFAALVAQYATTAIGAGLSDSSLYGIWFCTDVNANEKLPAEHCVLIFHERDVTVVTKKGVSICAATTNGSRIDLLRGDGKTQLGRYHVDDSTLLLGLGDTDADRPCDYVGNPEGRKSVHPMASFYRFTRLPTATGLANLRRALAGELRGDQITDFDVLVNSLNN